MSALSPPLEPDGTLVVDPDVAPLLARAGLTTVEQVLARAVLVRDLPTRSNHVLALEGARYFVKRRKARGGLSWGNGSGWFRRVENPPREAAALRRLEAVGVPAARVAFQGVHPRAGSLTATCDLSPARPLDDVLRERNLTSAKTTALLRAVVAVLARLHDAGLALGECYANQVHVEPGQSRVWLLDAERLTTHRGGLSRPVLKDLACLAASLPESLVPVPLRSRLIVRYIHMRNLPMRKALSRLERAVFPWAERIRRRTPRTPVGAQGLP